MQHVGNMNRHTILLCYGWVVLALASIGTAANPYDLHSTFDGGSGLQTIEAEAVVVAIVSDEMFYVNKTSVARRDVITEIDNQVRLLPTERHVIYIKAMPDVSYGTVVEIIDEARARGYDRIGLAANKTSGQPENTVASVYKNKENEGKHANTQTSGFEEERLTVVVEPVRGSGVSVKVGKTSVSLRGVAQTVRAHLKVRTTTTVMLTAPGNLRYGSVLSVIDEVKKGGAEMVWLSIKRE